MDFGVYPPEINSGRIYAGPGPGPMLAAAAAWDQLAFELQSTAEAYRAVVSGLTAGPWLGASSRSMAATAAPYVAWLSTTAVQAEETATQAKAAVAAYEAAFVSTVPPPAVAANRSLLMALVATNFLGQNTPAIAATEAQYAEMWAQDATAMYGYAASSASATTLMPFTSPAGKLQSTISTVPQALSAVPNTLQSLSTAAPVAQALPSDLLTTLNNLITVFLALPANVASLLVETPLAAVSLADFPWSVVDTLTGLHTDEIISGWAGVAAWPGTDPRPPTEFRAIITGPLAAPAASAPALGRANTVGGLSVPPTWTLEAPAVRPVALTLPVPPETVITAAAGEALEAGSGSTFSEMLLAGMTGQTMVDTPGSAAASDSGKAATSKHAWMRPATNGEGHASHGKPRIVVTGIAARIREIAKLRDEGSLTDEEYTEEKNRLLGR